MPVLKLNNFSGISPRIGATNLAVNQAQKARNVKIMSGELRAWRKPVSVYTTSVADAKAFYQLRKTTGEFKWLEWSYDTDVVPSPVVDTTDYRIYYTNGVAPKKTNWDLATTSGTGTSPFPDTEYNMGVPAPTVAPTLSAAGGTAPTETRSYIYTYVSTFGAVQEESAPSPATLVTCNAAGSTVTVSAFGTAPTTSAGYNITSLRIYRLVTGATTANYFYVGQVTINPATGAASGSFSDTVTVANLGAQLTSLYYTPPPATLQGLIAMPNGILAGFTNNQVWFCEPYLPHAWPVSYMMTVGSPIVGLGVFGQSLVVCTTTQPYLITGSQPGAMTQEKLPVPEPCVSKRSIASDQFGVLYASPNGVVSIAPGSAGVISRQLFTRDEWQTFVPSSMVGAIYQNMYMVFYQSGNTKEALVMLRNETPPLITLDVSASAIFVEPSTAKVYVLSPTDYQIRELDADTVNNMFYEWRSKKFILPEPTNFSVSKTQADWQAFTDNAAYNAIVAQIVAYNQAIWAAGTTRLSTLNRHTLNGMRLNGSLMEQIPTTQDTRNIQIILYANGVQVFSTGITTQEPVRLPATEKDYVWEIEITGNVSCREFTMATTVGELRTV